KPSLGVVVPTPGRPRRGMDSVLNTIPEPPAPKPTDRLKALATEVASSMDFMVSKFGPPALPHVAVSPIPGPFGQGFPVLIYFSALAYRKTLPPTQNSPPAETQLFFDEVLQAHEVAHQWWGNRVTSNPYRDGWIMEALANTSALMYLEKHKG